MPQLFTRPLIAHLDLKGVQRRPDALLAHLNTLAELGYTGLLVEYEDVFPFADADFSTESGTRWSRETHATFLQRAQHLGLEIIPLQQSLAHLEYAFRHERYRPLSLTHPKTGEFIESTTLHLGNPTARDWMKGLISEMVAAHPNARQIHLGMDESWALGVYARESGQTPLAVFLSWLNELCDLCDSLNVTPMIWSDMIEDHLDEENLDALTTLRDRVILVHWDYLASHQPTWEVRFSGWRTSNQWRKAVRQPAEATLRHHHQWSEEWPPKIAALAEPYRVGERHFEPLFQAAVWKQLGFPVYGACGIAMMMEGAFAQRFHRRMNNVDLWKDRVQQWQLDGLIVTAWARGGTFHPPTVLPDLHLPLLAYAAGASTFFGVPVEAELALVGRCVESWGLWPEAIAALEAIQPTTSQTQWHSLVLSVRLLRLRAEATGLADQVRQSRYSNRCTWLELSHRQLACRERREALAMLRDEVATHLQPHYDGAALQEWFTNAFDLPARDLAQAEETIGHQIDDARRRFS